MCVILLSNFDGHGCTFSTPKHMTGPSDRLTFRRIKEASVTELSLENLSQNQNGILCNLGYSLTVE